MKFAERIYKIVVLCIVLMIPAASNANETVGEKYEIEIRLVYSEPGSARLPTTMPENGAPAYLGPAQISTQHLVKIDVIEIEKSFNAALLSFTEEGQKILSLITEENIGNSLAILVNNKVVSTATIREPIHSNQLQVAGNFTAEEMRGVSATISNSLE